ncbi:hypothetical protein GQ53DRAFT_590351, partial [Thozetella sp. PMI_491]
LAPSAYCNDCILSVLHTQLAMPMASKDNLATVLSSLTSSYRSIQGLSTTKTVAATTFTIAPTKSTTPTCSGSVYTVQSSDSCQSISTSKRISTYDLLWSNNLSSGCSDFPASGVLCIPFKATCEPYLVKTGESCSSIMQKFSISYAQLITWNPPLGLGCQGMESLIGYVICISPPGG